METFRYRVFCTLSPKCLKRRLDERIVIIWNKVEGRKSNDLERIGRWIEQVNYREWSEVKNVSTGPETNGREMKLVCWFVCW